MMFCPKCGAMLLPKKQDSKKMLHCSCGYKSKDVEQARIKEVIRNKTKVLEVVDREEVEILPLTDADCQNCKHKKAFYWLVQTRAGDEPETKFLRCQKCKHTWRDYA